MRSGSLGYTNNGTKGQKMTAQKLLNDLRYQISRPRITTVSPCKNGCRISARGGGECWKCLASKLDKHTQGMASVYAQIMLGAYNLFLAMEDMVYDIDQESDSA